MAYSTHYFYQFRNLQNDIYTVLILQKDYGGYEVELTATDNPFVLQYQSGDGEIFNLQRPSEATIEFWNYDTGYAVQLSDFYSDDDTAFKIEFRSPENTLLWTGFLQLDNSNEALQDTRHPITLNANDNLGLLDNLPIISDITGFPDALTLIEVIKLALDLTNLELPLNAYLNIFENTTVDRGTDPTADFLQQTIIYINTMLDNGTEFKSAFQVLNDLCNTFRMQLFQADGVWNIIRQGEFRLFDSGIVPGTGYSADFTTLTTIETDPAVIIGRNYDIFPINENQTNRILRPLQFSKKTFNYNRPDQLIRNANLQELGAHRDHAEIDGFIYDSYEVPDYWVHRDGGAGNPIVDDSYIEIKVRASDGEEVDRYVVSPLVAGGPQVVWLQLAPIPITAGDLWNFTINWRTVTDIDDPISFYIRIDIFKPDCEHVYFYAPNALAGNRFIWNTATSTDWPNDGGFRMDITAGSDSSQYQTLDVSQLQVAGYNVPKIPIDGIMLIAIAGDNNGNPDIALRDMLWNNPNITFQNNITGNQNIVGDYNKQSQDSLTKNVSDTEVVYSDSPSSTIDGTLYTDSLSDFACADLDNIPLTRTALWHRAQISEAWRLQQIQTFDELFIQRKVRTIVEGDWFGLRYNAYPDVRGINDIDVETAGNQVIIAGYGSRLQVSPGMLIKFSTFTYTIVSQTYSSALDNNYFIVAETVPGNAFFNDEPWSITGSTAPLKYLSLLNALQINFYPGYNFLFGIATFNYKQAQFNATLYEVWDTGEVDGDLDNTYLFNYIFQNK